MDEFLSEIYTLVFKQWILYQGDDKCTIELSDDESVVIKTKYSQSTISFYNLNIIEFSVKNNITNEAEFYLHFQMKNMKHALELFNEMLDTIEKLMEKPKLKVLLSCSGGLTTGYFADRINEVAKLLAMDIQVDAVGYSNLYKVGEEYDIIMLAPQISYMRAKVCEILKNQIILKIPPSVFAKYDVKEIIAMIEKEKNREKSITTVNQTQLKSIRLKHSEAKILCLFLIRNSYRVHIGYRLYDEQNNVLVDNEIIKNKIFVQDYYDVIDSMIAQYPDIKVIGVSTPGIIDKEYIYSMSIDGLSEIYIEQDFESKYKQKFVFCNDVNTIALGYYTLQEEYSSLSFIFQPLSSHSGVGSVVDNQLLLGHHNIAGEVQYLPLSLSKNVLELHKTPEGAIESLAKTIISIISLLDPELIVICCFLITDINELKKEVEKYIPKKYIPEMKLVDYMQEYMLLGTLSLCIKEL